MKKHKGILAKRSLRPVKEKKIHKPDDIQQELQCAHCKTIFPDYLARCPECGSDEWTALVEVNPYSRIPMESIVKGCGHMLWMLGLFGFFVLVWQMDTPDPEQNRLYLYAGITCLAVGIIASTAFSSLSELMRRTLRMQRRLKVFHEHYNETHPIKRVWKRGRNQ
ncbi:MAG: translation initiation factor IF-2 [Mailhella sp.]|nr:translation initiation factor IF-2 [Mailhella sp.]